MRVAVLANDLQWNEMIAASDENLFVRIWSLQNDDDSIDGYIILENIADPQLKNISKPVLINAVTYTLKELNAATNVLRINGWLTFLQRKTWEVAGNITGEVKALFAALNKQYVQVADEPGLIAARPVAMIINEAYFALDEQVSTRDEIDTAMKLGTNYPYGPFEWAQLIGEEHICNLLFALSRTDKRYLPAPLLEKESA